MKVLLIGSGGREAALAWALAQSPRVSRLVCAPGNAGIAEHADCIDLSVSDIDGIVKHAQAGGYGLVVVGPEAPLVAGLADRLEAEGIPVFGASARAAEIEGSKIFSKQFMDRHEIPTAAFRVFDTFDAAREHLSGPDARYPLVVKADGLAAGKGVILADDRETALQAARGMLDQKIFGDAGASILIEDRLVGREVSVFVITDGSTVIELATCQDYKRALDGDQGLNTGGMGTYSPSVFLDAAMTKAILNTIVEPTIRGMAAEDRTYKGVLYVGLMLTADGPKVLEYNARFGDPETQVLLPRLDGDWFDLLYGCATGSLPASELRWKSGAAVCVVMTAGGYPESYGRGFRIEGLADAASMKGVHIFHAGTQLDDSGDVVTTGGRVLGVTALGRDHAEARGRAYEATSKIRWQGEHHRKDIATDAVDRLQEESVQ